MITTAYRVEFPPDVVVRDGSLCDGALNQSYPLNDTANITASAEDGRSLVRSFTVAQTRRMRR